MRPPNTLASRQHHASLMMVTAWGAARAVVSAAPAWVQRNYLAEAGSPRADRSGISPLPAEIPRCAATFYFMSLKWNSGL